ncbi:TetR family transcriptional regulator [Nocardiopsis sp. CNR-923]|uniref:TetR/AcrR family transcriptional regulator n=1 Tax=Nocardiopsis sp. CNR-923 TaxID=1904965 RepID=UPI0009645D65|nr:TetR/AcrR family transcriptional regulator [Nocardiopsis sp. CNR-923]OLT28726.1 TetR family transcriptional regulator [Nocardiopsis sp. CNR-923]
MDTPTDETRERRAPDPRRRSERARRAILDAAAELIVEVGYAKLTMDAIAARAKVGKQTIYRWWPSKAVVVLDVFERMTGVPGSALPDTGDLAADLRTVLHATVDEFASPETDRVARAFTAEIQHDPELAATVAERLTRPNDEALRERLRAARAAGQLDPDLDLDIALELVTAPITRRWLMRTAPLTHAYVDELLDTALRAIGPR